ncbi:hypothetical protein BDW68DRAFT_122988 [Aspergillus falconensis]
MGSSHSITFFFFEETMFFRDEASVISGETVVTGPTASTPQSIESAATDDLEILAQRELILLIHYFVKFPYPAIRSELREPISKKLKLRGFQHPQQPNPFRDFSLPIQLLSLSRHVLQRPPISWYNVVIGSLALILSNAPTTSAPTTSGSPTLPASWGSIGCFSGWMPDVAAARLARCNGGIVEPEQRLWIFLVALAVRPACCHLYGVIASYGAHWSGIVIGLGLIVVRLPLGSSLAYTYILDKYKRDGRGRTRVGCARS